MIDITCLADISWNNLEQTENDRTITYFLPFNEYQVSHFILHTLRFEDRNVINIEIM